MPTTPPRRASTCAPATAMPGHEDRYGRWGSRNGALTHDEKEPAKGNEPTTVVANDPDDRKGALKNIGGSQSDHWNNTLANQAAQALWIKNSDARDRGPPVERHRRRAGRHRARRTSWKA